jgi:hypothetical protein
VAAFGGANTARGDSSNTTRAVRESADRNSAKTADDETSNQRASHEALNDHLASQNSKPSFASKIDMRPPADAAQAAFAIVWRVWPTDHMGDERKVPEAFDDALAAAGGDTNAVVDAVEELLWESGADVPLLPDALATIARDLRQQAKPQEDEQ